MGQVRGRGARPEDLPPGLTASGPQRSRSAVSEGPPPCPTHPSAIAEPHQDVPSQLPTLQPSGCWAGCPAPSYSAHRPAHGPPLPHPREPSLTHGGSVQQGPLSRPEVRAPRACGVALKPARDLGQVLEAQPLAWDMGTQEKAPVLSSERSGTRPGQACGRGHPRLLA